MRRLPVLATLLRLVAGLGFASSMLALPSRVFVSARSGNDANACDSVLTPCQTFQGGVNQVAAGGEVIALDSGGYGRVLIMKAVKIEAPPGIVAFVHPSNPALPAVSISAGATDSVILRGLVLSVGDQEGIHVGTGGELHVENCVVDGFLDGIRVDAPGKLFVLDTIIRNCSGDGIHLIPTSGTLVAAIERSRLDKNGNGLDVGGLVANTVKTSIKDSIAVGQTNTGLRADTQTGGVSELNIENCLVANNHTGIFSFSNGGVTTVRVSNTTVTNNEAFGVNNVGGATLTRGNNTVEGNSPNGSFTGAFLAK